MKILYSILLFWYYIVSGSCSNTRFLAKDELLYTGRKDIKILNPEKVEKTIAGKKSGIINNNT